MQKELAIIIHRQSSIRGILKYDQTSERFVFKSSRENLELSAGMDLEILVEDYFTGNRNSGSVTRLEYLPEASGGAHENGWYITEDKELELEGAMARIRKNMDNQRTKIKRNKQGAYIVKEKKAFT